MVLLFDLDDTLLVEKASAEESFIAAINSFATQHGINSADLHRAVRSRARELWYSLPSIDYCLKIGISSWEGLWAKFNGDHPAEKLLRMSDYQVISWERALKDFSIDDRSLAIRLSERFQEERRKRHFLFPDTIEALTFFSGKMPLGLVTNGLTDVQMEKIQGGGIGHFFDHIIISGDVGAGKPDQLMFKNVLDRFGVSHDECIMIGDTLETDIAGAHAAGFRTVWLNRSNREDEVPVKPDEVIHSLAQLSGLLVV